jgi:hypothetical protein
VTYFYFLPEDDATQFFVQAALFASFIPGWNTKEQHTGTLLFSYREFVNLYFILTMFSVTKDYICLL